MFANLVPAFGTYSPPTEQEQYLYKKLLEEFQKINVQKKYVADVLNTFDKPLIISFPCDGTDKNELVVNVVKTKLAKFNQTQAHGDGVVLGGTYTWQCTVTTSEGKITMDCDNELALNPDVLSQDSKRDPRIQRVEKLVILYHELLHGQLMVDAIKSSENWRNDVCNKSAEETIDYSYSDKDHKIIAPLQADFASQLVSMTGGIMLVQEIKPEGTDDGAFTKKLGNLSDYPKFKDSGIQVTLRGSNLINTKFLSPNSDIILSGNLLNKTQSGIAWIYIFDNPEGEKKHVEETETPAVTIPSWIKKNAGWWAEDKITASDFLKGIEYLIQQGIISVPETAKQQNTGKIPEWVKKNAAWWYEGEIDDKTFATAIQYLISIGVISV